MSKVRRQTSQSCPLSPVRLLFQHVVHGGITRLDVTVLTWFPPSGTSAEMTRRRPWGAYTIGLLGGAVLLYGLYRAESMLLLLSGPQWRAITVGVGATLLRVVAALAIALSWTLPLGVAIGTRPNLAARVQPLAQIAASIPAAALFPVVVLVIAGPPAGMEAAAVLLMLMGTQWYLLFNVMAGASPIPQDLQYTAGLLQLSRWQRWRILLLPALFPYLITGGVTASGGAWNASMVAEYADFAGQPRSITGVGALIAQATASGTYPLLLVATLAMIGSVVTINRLVWRRLYRVAEARYRLE